MRARVRVCECVWGSVPTGFTRGHEGRGAWSRGKGVFDEWTQGRVTGSTPGAGPRGVGGGAAGTRRSHDVLRWLTARPGDRLQARALVLFSFRRSVLALRFLWLAFSAFRPPRAASGGPAGAGLGALRGAHRVDRPEGRGNAGLADRGHPARGAGRRVGVSLGPSRTRPGTPPAAGPGGSMLRVDDDSPRRPWRGAAATLAGGGMHRGGRMLPGVSWNP